jgi:hypothetical protein
MTANLHHETKNRLAWRQKVALDLGVVINPPLSFRAARFAAQHKTREELVRWLIKPNTVNTWQMGKKTYTELCLAFGLAVPARAPQTLGAQLAQAQARIAELEAVLEKFKICDFGMSTYAIREMAREALRND